MMGGRSRSVAGGGTGSGKTTLSRHRKRHFGDAVTVIGLNSYYKRPEGKTYEERAQQTCGHPVPSARRLMPMYALSVGACGTWRSGNGRWRGPNASPR